MLMVDDVLATGGTAAAAVAAGRTLGGDLHGLAFLIELLFLNGRARIAGTPAFSVLQGPAWTRADTSWPWTRGHALSTPHGRPSGRRT